VTPVHLYCSTCSKTRDLIVSIRFGQAMIKCCASTTAHSQLVHYIKNDVSSLHAVTVFVTLRYLLVARPRWASGKGSSSGG
jgi:hypothetical protein